MPYKFTIRRDDGGVFQCPIQKYRCEHLFAGSTHRCKRNQYIGFALCFQHLAIDARLKIAPATNPDYGKGLFATNRLQNNTDVVFKKDQRIIQYRGDVINKKELDERYGISDTAPYAYHINRDMFVDSACLRSAGSLANHKPLREANAKLYFSPHDRNAYIKATKNIRNNEEIFVNYGRAYKFAENHATRYKRR